MDVLFIRILNMSITASYLILAILLFRFLFKRIPARYLCLLWGMAGLRLIVPWDFESMLSLIPSSQTITPDILLDPSPKLNSGIAAVDLVVNPTMSVALAPDNGGSVNPLQVYSYIAGLAWIAGILILTAIALVSYIRLRRRVAAAVRTEDGLWECDAINTPFILGFFRPRIYLPAGLQEGREAVVAHERAHLKRFDHLTKPLAYAVLMIHWFNPLAWIAFRCFCRDMEKACDQRVVSRMSTNQRKAYASALLYCSVKRPGFLTNPLAFGEIGVKARIEEVLRFVNPSKKYLSFAVVLCVMLCLCFAASPKSYAQYAFNGKTLDQAVSEALLSDPCYDECPTEGHRIIGTNEDGETLKVYVIESTCSYGFVDDKFIQVTGSAPGPAVIYFDLKDGRHIKTESEDFCTEAEALKNLFPARLIPKALMPRTGFAGQEKAYARAYLKKIGREAEIGTYLDVEPLGMSDKGISTKVENSLYEQFPQYLDHRKVEFIKDGVRYVRETIIESAQRLILKTYRYDTGTVTEQFIIDIKDDSYKVRES